MTRHRTAFVGFFFALAACSGGPSIGEDAGDGTPPGDTGGEVVADTWTNWANGFFMTYCDSCHQPGHQGDPAGAVNLDFTMYSNVLARAAEIRCGTAPVLESGCSGFPPPSQFPIAAPYPTDAERYRLVAWIDAGTPF